MPLTISEDVRISNLLFVAQNDLGTCENPRGSNSGVRVDQMLKNCGLDSGYPWCAAAVVTWLLEATGGLSGIRRSAGCDELMQQAQVYNALRTQPQVGDVFFRLNPQNKADANHTGLVAEVFDDGDFLALAGNTNDEGSREGYEVAQKRMSNNGNYRFYSPFVIPNKPALRKIPGLMIHGELYECPYNYKTGKLWVPCSDFTKRLHPGVTDTSSYKTIYANLPSSKVVNNRYYSTLRDLMEKIGQDFVIRWEPTEQLAYITATKHPI